jgi:hypothetical protein
MTGLSPHTAPWRPRKEIAMPEFLCEDGRFCETPIVPGESWLRAKSPCYSSSISTELFNNYPNDFGDVRTGRAKQQAILMAFYL